MIVLTTDSQSFNVDAWEGHRYKAMITQAQNAVWSVGAFISPFIMKPFLVELVPVPSSSSSSMTDVSGISPTFKDRSTEHHYHFHNATSATSVIVHYISTDNNAVFHTSAMSDYESVPEGPQISIVCFAYIIVGLLSFVLALPTFAMYFYANGATLPCRRRQERSHSKLTEQDFNGSHGTPASSTSGWPSRSAVFYVIVVFCIGMLYGGLELTPRSFLTSFVVSRLSWTVRDATLLLSVFYAAFGSGRLVAVPLSLVISPAATLIVNIIFIGAGYTTLLMIDFVVHLNPIFVWIGSGLIGFGLSSSFACLVLVVPTTRPKYDGRRKPPYLPLSITLSALGIGCNVGAILFPVLVGNLFDLQSPMWMVYIAIFVTVSEAVLLVLRYALGRLYWRKYTKLLLKCIYNSCKRHVAHLTVMLVNTPAYSQLRCAQHGTRAPRYTESKNIQALASIWSPAFRD